MVLSVDQASSVVPLPNQLRYTAVMSKIDWGSVPAWIGAGSLLLAFRVFLRDRSNADRAQVENVGVWYEADYERKLPGAIPRVEKAGIRWFFRNANELPIEIAYLSFEINTRWDIRDLEHVRVVTPGELPEPTVWTVGPGVNPQRRFIGPLRLAPGELREALVPDIDLSQMAPENADQLDFQQGVTCRIHWILVADNANRQWEVRPMSAKRARRIRWWSRRREYYPVEWRNKVAFGLAVRWNQSKASLASSWKNRRWLRPNRTNPSLGGGPDQNSAP